MLSGFPSVGMAPGGSQCRHYLLLVLLHMLTVRTLAADDGTTSNAKLANALQPTAIMSACMYEVTMLLWGGRL